MSICAAKRLFAVKDLFICGSVLNSQTRCSLIEALGEIGHAAKHGIQQLVTLRVDKDKEVRWAAMIALEERIDPQWQQKAISTLPHLIKALIEKDNEIRCAAAEVLGEIGPAAAIAVPDLVKALADKDNFVRRSAIVALECIEPNTRVNPLLKTNRLEKHSPITAIAIPHLLKALMDSDWEVRKTAAFALGKIGTTAAKAAVSPLINALNDSENEVRYAAIEALGKMGTASITTTLPHLINGLSDQDSDVRCAAAQNLWKMGEAGVTAIPHLVKALVDRDESVRNAANKALTKIDAYWARRSIAHSAIPYLIKALTSNDKSISCSTAEVLGKMGPNAGLAVPDLMNTLVLCQDEQIRWAIEAALNEIDPKGKLRKNIFRP